MGCGNACSESQQLEEDGCNAFGGIDSWEAMTSFPSLPWNAYTYLYYLYENCTYMAFAFAFLMGIEFWDLVPLMMCIMG